MSNWRNAFLYSWLPKVSVAAVLCLFSWSSRAQLGVVPVIQSEPTNQTVLKGGTATFTVDAFSLLPMNYQWYHNGYPINGATASTYTISNVQYFDPGAYHVEVKNIIGKDTSRAAALAIVYPAVKFDSGEMVTNGFRMTLSGPAASNYVIYASANLTSWMAISTNAATTGSVTFTDTTARSRQMRFYRATAR